MDSREARLAFGFLLLGLTPIIATIGNADMGIISFSAGIFIAISSAFT